ncbi:MAG TPA: PAS domain-containing sensor histidine kinase, partial [Micavibrio sp.]
MNNDILDHSMLFQAMPVPRFLLEAQDGAYIMVDANLKALEYFNRSGKDVKGKDLKSILPADAYRHFEQSFEVALVQNKPVTIQTVPDFPGGLRVHAFWINPVMDRGRVMLDIFAQPTTVAPSSLQRERDDAISLLTSVFDVSEVGIVVTDRHQRIVRVNDSFLRIYGWNRSDLVGQNFIDLISPEERSTAQKTHDAFISSEIRNSGEMRILRKDRSSANVLFTTAVLELSNGRRFQVTTVMDITMRKQMELSLHLAKEQADSANQAKSTFLANMSHELRTPLNAIIGFSEMMMKETFGPLANDKYTEYLGDIHLSARHLLEIINEVLDMSKIEAGRLELDEDIFDVAQLIQSVSRMMDSRAFSGGLKIKQYVQDELPPLYADPRLVRQILINLVGNAVKYSNPGGTIEMRAVIVEDGSMQMIVTDQGIGIPKERIKDALEPFGQVSQPVETRGIQGTGLGLPLAKAMAELHGGTLELASEVGFGTMVTVELPSQRVVGSPAYKKRHADDNVELARRGE